MKIAHLCLSCFYIDGFSYQENELVREHVRSGHDVLVVASTETFDEKRRLSYTKPGRYLGGEGAPVIRLPYRRLGPHFLRRKIRAHPGVGDILSSFGPDVILFHGLCGWEILSAARFVAKNPTVRLFADSHEDFNNSARNALSKWLLHLGYYRLLIRASRKRIAKFLCVSTESMGFVSRMYGIPREELEWFPIGGRLLEPSMLAERRSSVRGERGLSEENVVVVQTGKFDRNKRLIESIVEFTAVDDENLRFLIAGSLTEGIRGEVLRLVANDHRISYLGWQSPSEMLSLLAASDVYLQPGSQSATMQASICAGCAVILADVESHQPYVNGNGWLISNCTEIGQILQRLSVEPERIAQMSARSLEIGREHLDYSILADRITGNAGQS